MNQRCDDVIGLVSEVARRYGISSIEPLLESCRATAARDDLSIAIIGRFKAGKSSFLNHFLGKELLPVGVIPVTAVITEIGYGPEDRALVHFLDGRIEEVAVDEVGRFIAESENPENIKQVKSLAVELRVLEGLKGLRFVDTPGLESALAHNTEASVTWLPNVALALVAVSIDTPLSRHDISLIKTLYQYTPKATILVTKADLLQEAERTQVLSFMREQLTRNLDTAPEILLYSVKAGYEGLKTRVEEILIKKILSEFNEQRDAVLGRKTETLLRECKDYLALALASADLIESERESLKRQVIGDKETPEEVKSQLRLVIRHAAAGTRAATADRMKEYQREIENRLLDEFKAAFPGWTSSLAHSLDSFERWLDHILSEQLTVVSNQERARLLAPLKKVERQVFRVLQEFRDRLSERTERAFAVPLRTTEAEIRVEEPSSPDIRVGRVFDRNWELLSPVAPMWMIKGIIESHFLNKIPDMVEKNLSRQATRWADAINSALEQVGKEAERRLDDLIGTVERLITDSKSAAPQIRADLERLNTKALC